MNQRANGEGSIYRRADGRWTAACYVLRPDGTRVRRAVYGKTRKDVADQLAVLITKTKAGLPRRGVVDSRASRSTGSRMSWAPSASLNTFELSGDAASARPSDAKPVRSTSCARVQARVRVATSVCSSVGVRMPASRALACQVWHPSMYGLRSVRSFRGGPGIAPPRPMSS
jgi:hypothetical protein